MRLPTLLALLASLTLLAGCGGGTDDSTPSACLEGEDAYLTALEDAPGEVRLDGEVPISDCLAANQTGGDLAEVGAALVATATELNAEARADPGGDANLQLGYLVGAAHRGAEDTEGIHASLLQRLVVAARYSRGDEPLPPGFEPAYREGLEAGLARG